MPAIAKLNIKEITLIKNYPFNSNKLFVNHELYRKKGYYTYNYKEYPIF